MNSSPQEEYWTVNNLGVERKKLKELAKQDVDCLEHILNEQVDRLNIDPKLYFRNLVNGAGLPSLWTQEIAGTFTGSIPSDTRNLIRWAQGKKTNPSDQRYTTLGCILRSLLEAVGIEDRKDIASIIIRYQLYKDNEELGNLKNTYIVDLAGQSTPDILNALNLGLRAAPTIFDFKEFLDELLGVLYQIDFALIQYAFWSIPLPDDVFVYRAKEVVHLSNIDTLRKVLLTDYPFSQETNPWVLEFVTRLAEEPRVEQLIRQKLNAWNRKIFEKYNYSLPNISIIEESNLQSSLLILVRPQSGSRFLLEASLQPDITKKDFNIAIYLLDDQRGVSCAFDQIPEEVEKLIDEAKRYLERYRIGKKATYDLSIEFFLPLNYLSKKVDLWQIKDGWGDSDYLGCQHKVIIHSYDRFLRDERRNSLEATWKELQSLVSRGTSLQNSVDVFTCFKKGDVCSIEGLKSRLEKKFGLKISCAFPESSEEIKNLFKAAISKGVPLVLWTRYDDFTDPTLDVVAEMDKLLNIESLKNLDVFFESIRKIRLDAHSQTEKKPEECLGHHLAVLCDNPDRLPRDVSHNLREPGK